MELLIKDRDNLSMVGMLKGWFFVFGTGLLLHRLIYKPFSQLKKYQDSLRKSISRDSLTGLANRLALYEEADFHFQTAVGQRSGFLFLDLDKFKFVNDSLGHSYGDRLIKEFSQRLEEALEPGLTAYRLSGDEFVVWVHSIENESQLDQVAGHIMRAVQLPFELADSQVVTTVSIGGSCYPDDGSNIDEVLRCADVAMYKAKQEGGGCFRRYQPDMNEDFRTRLNVERYLRRALELDEFVLHYQPQYDVRKGTVIGFEALLRWQSPQLGMVPPYRFIPLAEDTHLIIPIGDWVLRKACSFISRLREETGQPYTISVNLSMLQIIQDNFLEKVDLAIAEAGLPPEALELEITESMFMESLELVNRKVTVLRDKGIHVALDDFGKGYSSLHCLMSLPISKLKIDKSFVDNLAGDHRYRKLTEYIVQIGLTFGMEVIAEGVESGEQVELLTAGDCHLMQGYLFSKPVPADEAAALVGRRLAGG